MNDIHLHWDFCAYDSLNEAGNVQYAVEITVLEAETESEALKKAKKIVTRKYYWLKKVWECNSCARADRAEAIQIEHLKLIVKAVKGQI